jgi:DNA polymerase (family 10)
MTLATIKKRKKEIEAASKKLDFPILNGAEIDIKMNGELAVTKKMLEELDIVIASIHQGFKQPKEQQTKRILKAMDNKHVNIIGHPTGRLIGERPGYELDFEKVFKKAKENNVFIEINAHPKRLDMNDVNARAAKEAGLMIPLNTDAHSIDNLKLMEYGVSIARRAWCEKKDILNALSFDQLLKRIER